MLLIFLVSPSSLSREVDRDDWVCQIDGFQPDASQLSRAFSKTGQFAAKFSFKKETAYPNNTVVNSIGVIGVWVSLGRTNGPLSFPIETFERLSNARRFLFDEFEQQATVGNVSCFLRHKSNGTESGYGLSALHSPLFYMKNISNISSQHYLSYIRMEENVYISSVPKNPDQPECGNAQTAQTSTNDASFQQWLLTIFKILDHLIWIIISVYSPYILTLFCSTVNTNTHIALKRMLTTPVMESQMSDSTRGSDVGSKATEHDSFPKEHAGKTDGFDASDFQDSASTNSSVQVNIQETSDHSASEDYELVSRSMAVSHDQHSGRDRTRNCTALSEPVPSRFKNDTDITKAQPPKTVRMIDIGDTAHSVGFRSLIVNIAFTKKKGRLFRDILSTFVKFVILLFVPLFVPLFVDLFVLLILRCLSGSFLNWPASLTVSAFKFTYTKYPVFFVFLSIYVFRCFCLCFLKPYAADCVPSFLCRKHVECFIVNSYIAKLLCTRCTLNACDECKATTDCPTKCEIPLNIKHNIRKQPIEILMGNYKYINSHLWSKFKAWLFQGEYAPLSSCDRMKETLKIYLSYWLGFFGLCILFVILVTLDMIVSTPVVALCYGRVWFAINYFENRRCCQMLFLALELVVIICSIIWTTYFSICSSLSLEVAYTTVLLTWMKYPKETILTITITALCWDILWGCYSSFTDKYDKLSKMLLEACLKNHAKDLEQYRREGAVQIPEDLLVSTRKLVSLRDNLVELIVGLSWRVVYILLLLVITSHSTKPDSGVLTIIVIFLSTIHPRLHGLFKRPKKQELEDIKLNDRVERHVDSYFHAKLD